MADQTIKPGDESPEQGTYSCMHNLKKLTDLGNLKIVSAQDPTTPRAALFYAQAVQHIDSLNAISFEIDSGMQPHLDSCFHAKKKFSTNEFPGFAYALNYGINQRIPIYASDCSQAKLIESLCKLDETLTGSGRYRAEERDEVEETVSLWRERHDELLNKRAEYTCFKIKEILGAIKGHTAHLCSEDQARRIEKIFRI